MINIEINNLKVRGAKLGTSNVNLYLGDRIFYTELEYIESTGQQFITTTDVYGPWSADRDYGYWDVDSEYKIEFKAYIFRTNQNPQSALITINDDYSPTVFYNSLVNSSAVDVSWKFPQLSLNYFTNVSPKPLKNRQCKLFDVDEIGESTVIYRCDATEDSYKAFGITLFGRIKENIEETDRRIRARLYYCRIYKDDVLLLDFIPVKTFKGDVGLYDKVNNKFIKSYEGTPFIAGPEI